MLKNAPRTVTAAPMGALSSAIAHGYLPQYGGFAAASLAPSISNGSLSSLPFKNARTGRLGHCSSGLVENQPLPQNPHHQDLTIVAEHLNKFKENKTETVNHGFNSIAEGIGPVCGGSDW
jgi:hypothetical protein